MTYYPLIYLIIFIYILFIFFQTNNSENFGNTCTDSVTIQGLLTAVAGINLSNNNLGGVNKIVFGTSDINSIANTISDGLFESSSLCIVGKGNDILGNRQITMWDHVTVKGSLTALSCNCPSDKRLKHNIKELDSVYESIKKLTPVSYELKKDNKSDFGLIAQEYYKIFPFANKTELIGEEPVDKTGIPEYYSVDYSKLSVILLQGLKETMNKLEETSNKLEETMNKLEETRNILDETRNKL